MGRCLLSIRRGRCTCMRADLQPFDPMQRMHSTTHRAALCVCLYLGLPRPSALPPLPCLPAHVRSHTYTRTHKRAHALPYLSSLTKGPNASSLRSGLMPFAKDSFLPSTSSGSWPVLSWMSSHVSSNMGPSSLPTMAWLAPGPVRPDVACCVDSALPDTAPVPALVLDRAGRALPPEAAGRLASGASPVPDTCSALRLRSSALLVLVVGWAFCAGAEGWHASVRSRVGQELLPVAAPNPPDSRFRPSTHPVVQGLHRPGAARPERRPRNAALPPVIHAAGAAGATKGVRSRQQAVLRFGWQAQDEPMCCSCHAHWCLRKGEGGERRWGKRLIEVLGAARKGYQNAIGAACWAAGCMYVSDSLMHARTIRMRLDPSCRGGCTQLWPATQRSVHSDTCSLAWLQDVGRRACAWKQHTCTVKGASQGASSQAFNEPQQTVTSVVTKLPGAGTCSVLAPYMRHTNPCVL